MKKARGRAGALRRPPNNLSSVLHRHRADMAALLRMLKHTVETVERIDIEVNRRIDNLPSPEATSVQVEREVNRILDSVSFGLTLRREKR
jgi:hypothetical protein